MVKRKIYKRSRLKQSLDQSQESLLQKSDTSNKVDCVGIKCTPLKRMSRSTEQLLHQRSPESVLFELEQPDLSCYDDLSPEIVPKLRRIKLDLNESDKKEEEENIKQKEPELIEIKQTKDFFKQNIDKSAEECFPLEKTLSMNDEVKLEMNDCNSLREERSFSKIRLDDYACNTELRSSKSAHNFPYGYTSEPATQFATCNSKLKPQNKLHNFPDKFQTTACESIDQYEEKWSDQGPLTGTRFEIVNEKNPSDSTGNQFTNNWTECRRILSNLRQLNSFKIRTGNQEFFGNLLPKYKKCDETRIPQTNSLSCNALCSLTSEENSNELMNKRHFVDETNKIDNKIDDMRDYREIKNDMTRIRTRSITSCSGSPPAKKCRTMLKFDDEEDVEKPQEPVASVTNVDLLPAEEKNVQNYFCPNTMITKESWSTGSPESSITSTLNFPAVSNSNSYVACLKEVIFFLSRLWISIFW